MPNIGPVVLPVRGNWPGTVVGETAPAVVVDPPKVVEVSSGTVLVVVDVEVVVDVDVVACSTS
jgi:hypothetical protein